MEVPRLGVALKLQLLAYTTATATPDLSCICELLHGSQQCQILNPLSKARIEPASSWIPVRFVTTEPQWELLLFYFLFCFLGPHPWHMEVPRLEVKSELQLLAYTTATATPDLSHVCDPQLTTMLDP